MASLTAMEVLQKAIYDTLTADETLQNLGVSVIDEASAAVKMPYVEIGDGMTETPFNVFDRFGKQTLITLTIWTQNSGFKQAQGIYNRVNQLLDYTPFTFADFDHVYMRLNNANSFKSEDGFRRSIILQYEAVLQQKHGV